MALPGDSFIESFGVPFEKTVGEVLQRRLAALRGVPKASPFHLAPIMAKQASERHVYFHAPGTVLV